MSKTKKILLSITLTVIALVVVLMLALPRWIDPNNYKDRIQQKVASVTGRELTIRGNIEWQLFPVLALKLPQVQLADTKEFGQDFMATVESTEIRINLLPLLWKKISIDRITLNGLTLNVVKNQAGQSNLDWLSQLDDDQADTGPAEQTDAGTDTDSGKKSDLIDFSINDIALTDTSINWLDLGTGRKISLNEAHLSSSQVSLDKPFPIDFGFKMTSQTPELSGDFALRAEVTLNRGGGMTVADLDLDATVKGPVLFSNGPTLKLSWKTLILDQATTFTIDDLALSYANLLIKGNLKQDPGSTSAKLSGRFSVTDFDLQKLLHDIDPNLTANMSKHAYRQLSLSVDLTGSPQQLSIPNLRFVLDRSTLTGKAFIGWREHPQVDFRLSLNEIDLDTYLPKQPSAPMSTTTANASGSSDDSGGNTKDAATPTWLQQLTLGGQINIDRIKVFGLTAGRVNLPMRASRGAMQVGPLSAFLYDGEYTANWTANINHYPARWQLRQQLEHINLGDLLQDYAGEHRLQGQLSFASQVQSRGFDVPTALSELQGRADVRLQNGSYHGIDLAYYWAKAQQLLQKRSVKVADTGKTEIVNLSASWQIEQGIAHNSDLIIVNPLLFTKGQGTIDLSRQTLDYRLQTSAAKRITSQGGQSDYVPEGIAMPLQLQGSLSQPSISIDTQGLQQTVIEEAGARLLDKVIDKIGGEDGNGDDVRDGVRNIIRGIFGE